MAHLGFMVFLVGLTVASWFASKVVPTDEGAGALAKVGVWGADAGLFFGVGILLMVVGGVIARRAQRPPRKPRGADDEGPYRGGAEATGMEAAVELLDQMAARLDAMDASGLPGGNQTLADELDNVLSDLVPDFLEHRKLMIDRLGLATFAEMIGSFAQMERGAARAWSALTDEAWAEVPPSLERAQKAAKRARALFDTHESP